MGKRSVIEEKEFGISSGKSRNIDNPYSHLAASIIIRAWIDLKNIGSADTDTIDSSTVNKWEVINFFRSDWCNLLLSFQNEVTHEKLQAAVMKTLND